MGKTTETSPVSSKMLFEQLTQRLRGKPEVSQRILAHIREVSGHSTLPAFMTNGLEEPAKVETLALCLRAVITGDFTKLKGAVPRGQAPSAESQTTSQEEVVAKSWRCGCKTAGDTDWSFNGLVFATAEEAKAYGADLFSRWTELKEYQPIACDLPLTAKWDGKLIHLDEKKEEQKPAATSDAKADASETGSAQPSVAIVQATPEPVGQGMDPKLAAVMTALQSLVQQQPQKPAGVDEIKVRQIVQQVLAEGMKDTMAAQFREEIKIAKLQYMEAIKTMFEKRMEQFAKNIAEAV